MTDRMAYIGCDVSKLKLDFCLIVSNHDKEPDTGNYRPQAINKTVQNSASGIDELVTWLNANGVADLAKAHVAMEGTGAYHQNAAFELADKGILVSICNPAQTKSYGRGIGIRNKNDKIDSFVLACFCQSTNPRAWTPPSPEAYELKVLISRTDALTTDLVREKNRAEKATVTRTPEAVIVSINDGIEFLERQLTLLQKTIETHINKHEKLKQDMVLLTSIPSIGKKVGAAMLALLHCYSFESAEQLAAYLGLVPTERQSGTSIFGKPHLSKHGPKRLRSLLYMAAVCAIRKNGNPVGREVYERLLKKGKAKKAALGAVMRKLAHICYGVFTNQTPFIACKPPSQSQ